MNHIFNKDAIFTAYCIRMPHEGLTDAYYVIMREYSVGILAVGRQVVGLRDCQVWRWRDVGVARHPRGDDENITEAVLPRDSVRSQCRIGPVRRSSTEE